MPALTADEPAPAGVYIAAGDLDGDGKADIIIGAGESGAPHVITFQAMTGAIMASFYAYDSASRIGVRVAAGDVDGDGKAEIITAPGVGGGPQVRVLRADGSELSSYFAYDPSFRGGVYVATGDLDNDGKADVITGAGQGGAPHVRCFKSASTNELCSFFAYAQSFTGGVRVGAVKVSNAAASIVTGVGSGGGPHVRIANRDGSDASAGFFAFDPGFLGGMFVGGN